MKVYLVSSTAPDEGYLPWAIFSNRDAAKEYVELLIDDGRPYYVQEHDLLEEAPTIRHEHLREYLERRLAGA